MPILRREEGMRARLRGVQVGVTLMLLLAGTHTVRAQDAGTWAAPPLQGGLAATFATLQVLDVVSTVNAAGSGREQEANPMVGGFANHPAAFLAVKGAMTAGTLLAMRRFSKQHPKAAAITLIAFNIGYSYVVSSNFRIASGR
jgi:hypothetical protein